MKFNTSIVNQTKSLSKIHSKIKVITAITAIVLSPFGSAVQAQTTLKWAHLYEVGSPYHQATLWAAEEIKKQTNGRVIIKSFPSSSLGKEVEINEGLDFGSVDIIYTGTIFAGRSYGPMAISSFPFVIRDYDHWKNYRDSDLFAEIKSGYEKKTNHNVTGFTYYGARHVTSNKAVNTPADMKGMKIRVPNAPMYLMFPKSVGANPSPLAFSEVYLALQQGLVDAQENPLPTIKFKRFYEVQKYINLTGHMTNSIVTIVAKRARGKLSESDYDKLVTVTQQAAVRASDEINEAEQNLSKWFQEQGVTVNKVDRGPFISALKPQLESDDQPFTKQQLSRLQAL